MLILGLAPSQHQQSTVSKLIDQRRQAKLQWLQNPSKISGDNLQNLTRETSRTFRNKKREYLKGKINELETNNKNENSRD
jgi:hypothetical protein